MNDGQLKYKMARRPVRFQERTVSIECIFNPLDYDEMELISERIREHWFHCLDDSDECPPMVLIPPAPFRTYTGFIQTADRGDQRHQSAYKRTYSMKLTEASTPAISRVAVVEHAPFLPTAADVAVNSDDWWQDVNDRPHAPGWSVTLDPLD